MLSHREEKALLIQWPVVAMGRPPVDGNIVLHAEVAYPETRGDARIVSAFEVRSRILKGLPTYRAYLWDEVEPELAKSLDAAAERILEAVDRGIPLKKAVKRYAKTDDEKAVLLADRFLTQYGAFTTLFKLRPKGVAYIDVFSPGSSTEGIAVWIKGMVAMPNEKAAILVDVGPAE